jgi:tetratricopeptide (TPR) repeat protein
MKRRWVFRCAALFLPILLLLFLELALRVFGRGYESSFFLRAHIDGREVLTENAKFGWRFFPPSIARTPEPVVLPPRKEPGTCRIFILGESAAMGDPDPAVGLPRMLHAMLATKFPQKKFEVVNVAMTAINSHVIREIAKECAGLEGDFWIVYAGNNEVVGPFGGGTVFGPQVPPLPWIRFTLWLKTTRVGQLLTDARARRDLEWEGMEMFLKQQVRHDDPRLAKVHANFQENLSDVVRYGTRSGAHVIVSTVAVNLRDCPPFASQQRRALNLSERMRWQQLWTNALAAESNGQWTEAAASFAEAEKVAGVTSTHAELRFHLARCAEAAREPARAATEFNRAKEFDTLRFRADDALNATIRQQTNASMIFVDAARQLASASSNGVPGAELFYEHVHFTFDGNYSLARLFFDEIVRRLPPEMQREGGAGVPTREQCAERLCWNEWKQREVFSEVRSRLQQPPFSAQFGQQVRDAGWARRIETLSGALTPERLRTIRAEYAAALARVPNDWVLHEDYAKFLGEFHDYTNALAHWRAVTRLLPHDAMPYFYVGSTCDELGMSNDAIVAFREALRRDADMVEAHSALGLALAGKGRVEAGKRELQRAIQIRPRYTQARVNLGVLFAKQGKVADARAQYDAVLRIEPENAAAHLNLGKLASLEGNKAAAQQHYRAALRSEPRNAVAHFNLGNLLNESASPEAIEHFRAAVAADPRFADAHFNLAVNLAEANNTREALQHFAEYVKLEPSSAEGHFNYGVALAKSRRFAEAVQEFRETLRLDPKNDKARTFLDQASAAARQ